MKIVILFVFLAALSCSEQNEKRAVKVENSDKKYIINYKRLEKIVMAGDFDGDGKQDSIFQANINTENGLSIDSCPDPWKHEWDTVVTYFNRNFSRITLSSSLPGVETLYLDGGLGFYCLINIGDNNHDKKDEIALVVDKADFTRVNYCMIYTICSKEWIEQKTFSIHESAFDYLDKKSATTDEIIGFLEKKKGKWKYLDYLDDLHTNDETEANQFQPLNLKRCK
jgi:hypothetical protein